MIMKMIKEICEPCRKPINIGQPLLEFEACRIAIHTKCYKLAGFCTKNSLWVCKACSMDIPTRYNPFAQMLDDDTSDKFYDDECAGEAEALHKISALLNNCQTYTSHEFSTVINQVSSQPYPNTKPSTTLNTQFSTYFTNLDGNSSNFNSLLVELKRFNHNFSVIGIAETNTDEQLKNLYPISGYNSFYQSTLEGKSKGTGVAIYIADYLNAEVI